MSGITRDLAKFGVQLRYEDLPAEVVGRILLLTLDQAGAQLAGSTMAYNALVRDYALSQARDGACTVIGSSTRVVPEWAACSNGTAGGGVEIDDYHPASMAHPGCVAVPAVLALAEHLGAAGRETIVALALAFESIIRVGLALQPSMTRDRGFHSTSVQGVFGAALGGARLLRLDAETAASALGLAGSHASGVSEYFNSGGDVKRLHGGLAAMGGVRAANLARLGFSGPRTVLEGSQGVLHAFASATRPGAIVDGLGERWELLETAIKPYACAGSMHAPIDAVRALIAEDGLRAEDVEEIAVGTYRQAVDAVGRIGPRPDDLTGAQFSLHASLAMTLVMGGNDVAHYRAAQAAGFRDPAVVGLAERIRLELDPEAEAAYPKHLARVRVRRKDGTTLDRTAYATGTSDAPITEAAVRAKYHRLAADVVGEAAATLVERAIDALADDAPARSVLRPLERS